MLQTVPAAGAALNVMRCTVALCAVTVKVGELPGIISPAEVRHSTIDFATVGASMAWVMSHVEPLTVQDRLGWITTGGPPLPPPGMMGYTG
jgi:hypothetical protein